MSKNEKYFLYGVRSCNATFMGSCTIYKQKRYDLRQVGLAMVVLRETSIPIFHHTYCGNLHDAKIFLQVIGKIKKRLVDLDLNLEGLTIVFDRGNNSKKNLKIVEDLKLHYIGALTPYHHKDLINEAQDKYKEINETGTVHNFILLLLLIISQMSKK